MQIAPEWRLMDQFTINNNHRAMKFDSTNSTNSMTNPLGPPQQLANNFNLIAYQKGIKRFCFKLIIRLCIKIYYIIYTQRLAS